MLRLSNAEFSDPKLTETLRKAIDNIIEGYAPEKIILFGSYAHGQPTPDSDFDLLIIKQTGDRPIDRRIAVRMLLRPFKLRPVVSPIVLTQAELDERLEMGDPFAEELHTQGRVLYERD